MVTIKEYIRAILIDMGEGINEVGFDIGTDDGKNVNMKSNNRVKFIVKRKND